MGYMSRINNVFLVLILALICSILPSSAMMYIGFVLILVHSYALGIEVAAFMLVLILLMLIFFLRFSGEQNVTFVFTPLSFAFSLPALLPIGSGLMESSLSAIPAGCGVVMYYFIRFLRSQSTILVNPDLDMTDKNIVLLDPRTVMQHPEKVGNNVVVIDKIGYWQAMGVADYIATLGSKISIVTDRLYVGVDIEETCRENLNRRLARKNVDSYTSFRLAEVNDKQVVLENIFDKERRITLNDVDTLVVAQDSRSDNELYKQLKNEGEYETYVLGDAAAPGTVLRIIFDAEELGRRI